jgi:hypothetical protein
MDETATIVKFVFFFGTVLGIGVWQLAAVRREVRRDRERGTRGEGA